MILHRHARRALVALPVLVAVIVSGCRVGPEYKRPDLAPPPNYRGAPATTAAESMADVPWWQVFDDPALQGLVRDAIANNPDLRLAVARVSEARALAGVAKSFLYPDINLNAGYTGNQASRNSQPPGALQERDRTFNNTAVTANMAWEIDLFGRLRSENDAAFNRYLAHRGGPSRGAGHAGRRCRDVLLPAARARFCSSKWHGGRSNSTTGPSRTIPTGSRAACPIASKLNQARANRSLTAASIPEIERQIAIIEHAISVLAGRAPGAITRGRSVTEQARASGGAGRCSCSAARAAPRRARGRAAADRGQCRHRRGQGAVLPAHQPHRQPRQRQWRPGRLPEGRLDRLVVRGRPVPAAVQCRPHPPQPRGRGGQVRAGDRDLPAVRAECLS